MDDSITTALDIHSVRHEEAIEKLSVISKRMRKLRKS